MSLLIHPYDRRQVLHPESALALAIVPQGRRVLSRVDRQELLYLPRNSHVPMHAQDVLGGGIPVPGEVGEGVDEKFAHVAIAFGPQGARYLRWWYFRILMATLQSIPWALIPQEQFIPP
jgi:hypothetical protein